MCVGGACGELGARFGAHLTDGTIVRARWRVTSRRDSDRGAGTIAAVGVVAAVLGLAALLAPVAGIATARHLAASAADAAALAAAAVVAGLMGLAGTEIGPETATGPDQIGAFSGDPCDVADVLAARHGATLDACQIDGLVVTIRVAVKTEFGVVRVTATAGPAEGARPWLSE